MTVKCEICDGDGWVCENHPNLPWEDADSPRACDCGGAGSPCHNCNTERPPRMNGTVIFDIEHGWRH